VVTVKRIYDDRIVRAVMEEMIDVILDDTPVDPETASIPFSDDHRWYATYEDAELVSIWYVHRLNLITWQLHIHFRPKWWGTGVSTPHARAAMKKVWTNTKAKKLYASVPDYATPVLNLAKRTGWKQEGRMKNSWQKGGEVYDQIHIGVYR
jgi:RimJ/RimL family protein N-acetyltransferase